MCIKFIKSPVYTNLHVLTISLTHLKSLHLAISPVLKSPNLKMSHNLKMSLNLKMSPYLKKSPNLKTSLNLKM
jgi:hypothetical protein